MVRDLVARDTEEFLLLLALALFLSFSIGEVLLKKHVFGSSILRLAANPKVTTGDFHEFVASRDCPRLLRKTGSDVRASVSTNPPDREAFVRDTNIGRLLS